MWFKYLNVTFQMRMQAMDGIHESSTTENWTFINCVNSLAHYKQPTLRPNLPLLWVLGDLDHVHDPCHDED